MLTSDRSAPLAALLERVRELYRETPGLRLTRPQAARLFDVAPSVGATMLRTLVREDFLFRTEEGFFQLRMSSQTARHLTISDFLGSR